MRHGKQSEDCTEQNAVPSTDRSPQAYLKQGSVLTALHAYPCQTLRMGVGSAQPTEGAVAHTPADATPAA